MRLIALLFLIPQFAFSGECDIQSFLKSALYSKSEFVYTSYRALNTNDPVLRTARSMWGKSHEIKTFQAGFEDLNFLHRTRPMMNVYKDSFAEKSPELIRILDDISRLQMRPHTFRDQFLKAKGHLPVAADYQRFYRSRVEIWKSGILEYLGELKKLDPDLATSIHGNLLDQAGKRHETIERVLAIDDVGTISDRAEGMVNMINGFMTELHAIASVPHVTQAGRHLAQMSEVDQILERRLAQVLDQISNQPKALDQLTQKYPKVFNNSSMAHYRFTNPSERVTQLRNWIRSKEIDVIRQQGGKTRWVEVKRNATPFDLIHFQSKGSKKKSLFDQIVENKQIIEFLGLSDKIQLEYLATGGMTPEVRVLLESNGIRVIPAH